MYMVRFFMVHATDAQFNNDRAMASLKRTPAGGLLFKLEALRHEP
jgi:hypothetical protein